MTTTDQDRDDLRQIVAQLSPQCRQLLGRAAGIASSRSHPALDIEHVALAVTHEPSETRGWLREIGIDVEVVRRELDAGLAPRTPGANGAPAIAGRLVDLLRRIVTPNEGVQPGDGPTIRQLFCAIGASPCLLASLCAMAPSWRALSSLTPRPANVVERPGGLPTMQALSRFTVDLTKQASSGDQDPVIGREAQIEQVMEILLRRRQNNPLLIGEAGVGKTAIAEGLAQRIVAGLVPDPLKKIRLCALDLGLLKAGASMQGELEARLKALIADIESASERIVLFVDEIHLLMGAGGVGAEAGVIANLIKPQLARGTLTTIGATTWSEYKRWFEKDAALARRFQTVRVPEPNTEQAVDILQSLVPVLERHHGVCIRQSAIDSAVHLSRRYLHHRQLPDKAISLLDTACAKALAARSAPEVARLESSRRAQGLASRIERLQRDRDAGEDHGVEITALTQTLAALQAQALTDASMDSSATAQGAHVVVAAEQVAAVVSAWTGIPVDKMATAQPRAAVELREALKARVMGQDEALQRISDRICAYAARLEDPGRPMGVFLLVGPSGAGKTETAHALAEAYFGESAITVISMSEYQEAHTVSKLKGAPPGYVGYGQGGVLTEAIRKRPYGVLLLDEVEKAHPDVIDSFLQVFDKGEMEDAEGISADFRNTMVLLTSNVGAELLQAPPPDVDEDVLAAQLQQRLLKQFKPEFLGRLQVIAFRGLSQQTLAAIARMKLRIVAERYLAQHGRDIGFGESLVQHMAESAQGSRIGARWIDHFISQHVLSRLAEHVLSCLGQAEPVDSLDVDWSADEVVLKSRQASAARSVDAAAV